jgi:uncharacterized protein (DUF1786 family)
MNESIVGRIEKETGKLSESMATIKRSVHQQIQRVSERVDSVVERMGVQHAELNVCVDSKLAKISELVTNKLKGHANDNKQLKSQISKELEVSTRELINKETASIHNKFSEVSVAVQDSGSNPDSSTLG